MQIPLLLDRSRSETLTTQLVDQLREAIRRGRIPPGARLPSSRALADELAIARNTATRAYETLVIEGVCRDPSCFRHFRGGGPAGAAGCESPAAGA
jgi:GntR family transcriptional regulator / MocR family aminotransferase